MLSIIRDWDYSLPWKGHMNKLVPSAGTEDKGSIHSQRISFNIYALP